MNLNELFLKSTEHHKVFSFIGMAKNVGKTTTFNYVHSNLKHQSIIGITSVGRDGEPYDIITEHPKPKIPVFNGTLLATAELSLERSNFDYEIISDSGITCPLGNVLVIKALSKGNVELSGPSLTKQVKVIIKQLFDYGAQKILIDGAFGRKSFASPQIAHATVLSTGAALTHDIDDLVCQTVNTVKKLRVEPLGDQRAIKIITEIFEEHKVALIDDKYVITIFGVITALNATKSIIQALTNYTKYIAIKGILSSELLNEILKSGKNVADLIIVVEDGTKIFSSSHLLSKFFNKGGTIKALHPINLLAVTSNPVSPYGILLNHKELLKKLRARIKLPVFDILSGG
jgi:hypothetical protein